MSRFDDKFADDSGKAVFTLGSITLPVKKIKSNNCQVLCVGRLINIFVYFLLRHLNWIERYSNMKIGSFLFEYINGYFNNFFYFLKYSQVF